MNVREIKEQLQQIDEIDFETIVHEQIAMLREGDAELMDITQQEAIRQIALRVAALHPDDPLLALCARCLQGDLSAMAKLFEKTIRSIR